MSLRHTQTVNEYALEPVVDIDSVKLVPSCPDIYKGRLPMAETTIKKTFKQKVQKVEQLIDEEKHLDDKEEWTDEFTDNFFDMMFDSIDNFDIKNAKVKAPNK